MIMSKLRNLLVTRVLSASKYMGTLGRIIGISIKKIQIKRENMLQSMNLGMYYHILNQDI